MELGIKNKNIKRKLRRYVVSGISQSLLRHRPIYSALYVQLMKITSHIHYSKNN